MTQTNFLSYVYLYMYEYLDLARENQMCRLSWNLLVQYDNLQGPYMYL